MRDERPLSARLRREIDPAYDAIRDALFVADITLCDTDGFAIFIRYADEPRAFGYATLG